MAKKVQSVTHQPLQQASNKINSEQLMNDLHYQQSRQIIQELLKKGLITSDEFNQIDTLNKQSFSPLLGPGNVDTSRF
ncbi:SHOCT domain-containing protein [Pediococcus acidilactici]|jgi:transcriptional regulator CtsR|uniref:SHOCT domain-containing protein n=1 Tax=Pediococcus acidilactici TaxID=1254 RepID=A0AAW8YJ13_PEDAC|nr:SHOCT domain-containing protein [Pediococcus acidilactici]MDV2621567.1 SHOCT domain-containing protein [Pediococcus acidilactici]